MGVACDSGNVDDIEMENAEEEDNNDEEEGGVE